MDVELGRPVFGGLDILDVSKLVDCFYGELFLERRQNRVLSLTFSNGASLVSK
jgi:hypothetical protein